ncbi:MAG: hypothetical protein IKX23_11670 [Treponema sp.]|nr:hypothetical protein [Treponema sp.]
MKKGFFLSMMIFIFSSLGAIEIPDCLLGIWEGKDRYVFFEKTEEENPCITIVLKEFYDWYFDRAAEDEDKSKLEKRIRNDATHENAEHITFSVNNILNDEEITAYEIKMNYSKRNVNYIPVAVIGDKMYLNFFIKEKVLVPEGAEYDVKAENEYDGIWRGSAGSEGIKVCEQKIDENIGALIVHRQKIFNIRYWKTLMPYDNKSAWFRYDNFEYYIGRHIYSAGNNYSCTTGRSTRIRNIVKPREFNPEDYIFNENKTILVTDKEPYLVKLAGKNDFETLMQLVKDQNAKRKPPRPPLFSPLELDWHWDLIYYLEKDNELIQKVRARQWIRFE